MAAERRYTVLLLTLVIITAVLFAGSLLAGREPLAMLRLLLGAPISDRETLALILAEIRLPRALLAVLVGLALGLAGAVLQGLLRNPLADPALIGATSTAALGAVVTLYFGLAALHPMALPAGGMVGALAGVLLVGWLAGDQDSGITLILAGVAINSLAGALTALALNLAPSPYAALEIVFWLLGSLADRSFEQVYLAVPFVLAGALLLLSCTRALDALTLGEDTARSLGFDLARLRLRIILGVGLAVGAAVAVAGSIGFVGLVVPHLLRPLVGQQPGRLLAASALGGAALLLAADIAVRLLPMQSELKLGVMTALVGAPFFLHLLMRMRRQLL